MRFAKFVAALMLAVAPLAVAPVAARAQQAAAALRVPPAANGDAHPDFITPHISDGRTIDLPSL
jgi:hypothetical protein